MGDASIVYDHGTGQASLCVTRSHGHSTLTHVFHAAVGPVAVLTPPAGRRICVNGVQWATDGNAGIFALDFIASGITVFRGYAARFQTSKGMDMHIEGDVSEPLSITTTTGAASVFMLVNYRIVDA